MHINMSFATYITIGILPVQQCTKKVLNTLNYKHEARNYYAKSTFMSAYISNSDEKMV